MYCLHFHQHPWSSSNAATAQSGPNPVPIQSQSSPNPIPVRHGLSSIHLSWCPCQAQGHQGRPCPPRPAPRSSLGLGWKCLAHSNHGRGQSPGPATPLQRGQTPRRARGPPGHPRFYLQRPVPSQGCPESAPLSATSPAQRHVAFRCHPLAACRSLWGRVTSIQAHPQHGRRVLPVQCQCWCGAGHPLHLW